MTKVSLFFERGDDSTLIAECFGNDERAAFQQATRKSMDYLRSKGIKPYYIRYWIEDSGDRSGLMMDYGSHVSFLRLSPPPGDISILF